MERHTHTHERVRAHTNTQAAHMRTYARTHARACMHAHMCPANLSLCPLSYRFALTPPGGIEANWSFLAPKNRSNRSYPRDNHHYDETKSDPASPFRWHAAFPPHSPPLSQMTWSYSDYWHLYSRVNDVCGHACACLHNRDDLQSHARFVREYRDHESIDGRPGILQRIWRLIFFNLINTHTDTHTHTLSLSLSLSLSHTHTHTHSHPAHFSQVNVQPILSVHCVRRHPPCFHPPSPQRS